MRNTWIVAGGISAFVAVAAGAFGAHALRERLSLEERVVFETAARYQMYHALALLAVGIMSGIRPCRWLKFAGAAFFAGTVVFSGSLYALSLTGVRGWGAVTPFGGLGFLVGWACLAIGGTSRIRDGG